MSDNPIIQPPEPGATPTPVVHTPVMQPDYLHPAAEATKKTYHPKRVMVILWSLVILSILVVGGLILYAAMPQHITEVAPQKQAQKQTIAPLSAKSTLELLRPKLPKAVDAKHAIALSVMAPGKDFYTVIPEDTAVLGLSAAIPTADQGKTITALASTLTTNHFEEQIVQKADTATGYLGYYTRNDVICQVLSVKSPSDATPVEVDCTDAAHYADYASAQQPFVSNYTPASSTSVVYAYVGKPVSQASKTSGYTLADMTVTTVVDQQLSTSGTLAAFYQTPDGLWHYFVDHDASVPIDCSKYNTPDLLSAYAGVSCKDSKSGKLLSVTAPKSQK